MKVKTTPRYAVLKEYVWLSYPRRMYSILYGGVALYTGSTEHAAREFATRYGYTVMRSETVTFCA